MGFASGSSYWGGEGRQGSDMAITPGFERPTRRYERHESSNSITGDFKAETDSALRVDSRTSVTGELDDMTDSFVGQPKFNHAFRVCNTISEFKNHDNALVDGIAAFDVLRSGSTVDAETEEELKLRGSPNKKQRPSKARPTFETAKILDAIKADGKTLTRIRVQSPALLKVLAREMQESWDNRPRTFFRPFAPLVFFHDKIIEALDALKKESRDRSQTREGQTPASSDNDFIAEEDSPALSVEDTEAALADLTCYVQFMNDNVMPLAAQFDGLDSESGAKRVGFHDLWYLFKPGEFVYRPVGAETTKDSNNLSLGQRTWRSFGFDPIPPNYQIAPTGFRRYTDQTYSATASFNIHAYYIDYTGEEFCVVTNTFSIQAYEGEKPITSLNVFPFRFRPNHREVLDHYIDVGRRFLQTTETRHAFYSGMTVTRTPRGEVTTDGDGKELQRSEPVESEVIVDFVEAFQACPSWKPKQSVVKSEDRNPSTTVDELYTRWWSDTGRTKLLAETSELIIIRSGVIAVQRNKQILERDRFLVNVRDNDKHNRLTTSNFLEKVDLALLPSRTFAYVLRDRKFAQLDANKLGTVRASSDAFRDLKINERYKSMIKSLVAEHFRTKRANKILNGQRRNASLDLIKGKGKGLFVLLHGAPGVGKTATAEAVAQANGKPLFAITCGDLGLTPGEVEESLRRIFRLANTWDCVLLLDEVDTFFSQRSKSDSALTKTALVAGK